MRNGDGVKFLLQYVCVSDDFLCMSCYTLSWLALAVL